LARTVDRVTRKKAQTAAEFVAQLERDPAYRERVRKLEEVRQREIALNLAEAEPVLTALGELGFPVRSFAELRRVGDYTRALPMLVEWLPRVSRPEVQGDIVRCLSVPTAVEARRPLLELFARVETTTACVGKSGTRSASSQAMS